jgi:hypothetical protein
MSKQHTKPCKDCPWRRKAANGWLGSDQTPEEWIQTAHSEATVECHVNQGNRCAGIATYRANICRIPRDAKEMRLPKDKEIVFSSPKEFIDHHRKNGKSSAEMFREEKP